MKKVLIVKTSSLGDVIHTLPALTDAGNAISDIRFDWVVEEGFKEVPAWHPLVDRVIPIAIRRWRKNPISSLFGKEVRVFWKNLRREKYDAIIDAQGLIKSAILTKFARGSKIGLDKKSLTEPLARFAYQKTVNVDLKEHAVFRMRSVFAKALGYDLPESIPDSGLSKERFLKDDWNQGEYIVFLHGTTWQTKKWPDEHWIELSKKLKQLGLIARVPWSGEKELRAVESWAKQSDAISVLPKMNLSQVAGVMAGAKAIVAVDTGLGHLAAVFNIPTISLYGPTDPKRIGTQGATQMHLVSDIECVGCDKQVCRKSNDEFAVCMKGLTPEEVFERIAKDLVE